MWWWILGTLAVIALAIAFRLATKNTPFDETRACTPSVKHLRHIENDCNQKEKN